MKSFCWWPRSGSEDERNVTVLITNFSEPDRDEWIQLPGKLTGVYDSIEAAERELKRRDGTASTTDTEMTPAKSRNNAPCAGSVDDAEISAKEVQKLIDLGHANSTSGKYENLH